MNDIYNIISKLDEEIDKTNIYFFSIEEMNSNNLKIVGSFDFSYYHEIEIIFQEVKFVSLPGGTFNVSKFRSASEEEKRELIDRKLFGDDWLNLANHVIIMEDDDENAKYHIVFEHMNYKFEKVYYFMKDNLKEGERIADRVLKRQSSNFA